MKSLQTAYILWAGSIMGFAGLHHFYLGRPLRGVLWLMTWGLFGIGTVYDALTMERQVRRARLEERIHRQIDMGVPDDYEMQRERSSHQRRRLTSSLEQAVLRSAQRNGGITTPSEVAIESGAPVDQAKATLDELVQKGIAEIRVRRTGSMVYVINDLITPDALDQLESLY